MSSLGTWTSRWRSALLAAMIALAALAAVFAGAGNRSASAFTGGGNVCTTQMFFYAHSEKLTLVHASHWPTDQWIKGPPAEMRADKLDFWASEGDGFRGCHSEVKYHVECTGFCQVDAAGRPILFGTVEISETMPWSGSESSHCTLVAGSGDLPYPWPPGTSIRFPRSHCQKVRSDVQPGTFGIFGHRRLEVVWSVYLGKPCVQEISPTRLELCL